ncbi:MerR, DNA binding [compost metagenome]
MRLKATGMTLEEMRHYLELTHQGDSTLSERYTLLEAHNDRIACEIAKLQETQDVIRYKLRHFRELAENPHTDAYDCEVPGDSGR